MIQASRSHSGLASPNEEPLRDRSNSFDSYRRYDMNNDEDKLQRDGEHTDCRGQLLDNVACAGGSYACVDCNYPFLGSYAGSNSHDGWCRGDVVRSKVTLSRPSWAFDGDSESPGYTQVPAVGH
jgi:hypothetical protein